MKTYKADCFEINPSSGLNESSSLYDDDNIVQQRISVIESTNISCSSCMKVFDNKQLLTRHSKIHTQTGPFPCDFCCDEFDDRYALRSHWTSCHNRRGNEMCNTCGESFTSKETLVIHQEIHERAKKHKCVECGKAFSNKSDLRKHTIIHTGMRPYTCPVCCKTFTRSTNLNKHQRLHSGLKPFSCSQCPKTFSCKGDLGRHQNIHTGVRPYSCSVCTLSFSRKDKLRKHEKMHQEGATLAFTCPSCPAAFSRKEELTKHTQFAHLTPSTYFRQIDSLLTIVSEAEEASKSCCSESNRLAVNSVSVSCEACSNSELNVSTAGITPDTHSYSREPLPVINDSRATIPI